VEEKHSAQQNDSSEPSRAKGQIRWPDCHQRCPAVVVMKRELLTAAEAATVLRIGRTTMYKLLADGTVPCVRLGPRLIRVRRTDLDEILEGKGASELSRPTGGEDGTP
jgi:excisionase family DNA binding protein